MKKFFSLIIAMLLSFVPVTVYADTFDTLHIEQACAELPDVRAFVCLLDGDGNIVNNFAPEIGSTTAMLGGEQIDIESIEKSGNEDITYYYLLDVSTSVSVSVLNKVKEEIKEHIRKADENEKIVVITFGQEVKVVIDGSESPNEAATKLDAVKPNETATRLFDGLDKMLTMSDNETEALNRKVAVLVSDGADLYNGGATKDEVLERIQDENIVLYSMALPNSKQNGIDAMRSFSKKSGGEIFLMKAATVEAEFDNLEKRIGSCFEIRMKTENNIVEGVSEELIIKIPREGSVLEAVYSVSTTSWVKDEVAPKVVSCESTAPTKVTVYFSEPVSGADNQSGYKVKSLEEEKEYEVISASYNSNELSATIIVNGDLYNGNYSVEISGVTDVSMEKNAIDSGAATLEINEEGRDRPLTFGEKLLKYWYLVLIILLVVAGAVVLIIMGVKKKKEEERMQRAAEQRALIEGAEAAVKKGIGDVNIGSGANGVRITTSRIPAKKVTLVINDETNMQKSVDVMINGKFTMGRSTGCNLSFDDKGMSREHCAFDYINGTLVVQDLGSTNGTYINGVRVDGVYSVNDGDVIRFGRTKITVRFAK